MPSIQVWTACNSQLALGFYTTGELGQLLSMFLVVLPTLFTLTVHVIGGEPKQL